MAINIMWKLLALLAALVACFPSCADAKPRGAPLANQIACNLVTGVASVGGPCTSGATCDGVANAAPAFWAFRTWALANQGASSQVILTVPPGSDCLFSTNAGNAGGRLSGVSNSFAAGINNLRVVGTGATLREGASGYWLGTTGTCSAGLTQAGGCSARIQSTSPGNTTVTLTAASFSAGYISRFSVGDWIMLGGLNTQALWNTPISSGDPPNLTYFEWRQITNVNAGTGVITVDRPLTKTLLSTWPEYNSGDSGRPDAGGPATIWTVGTGTANGTWNTTVEYVGLTFVKSSGQIYVPGRNVTFTNVTFVGGNGAIPTSNETWTGINSTWPSGATVEVDKLIGAITLDTVTMGLLQFQSNSTDSMTMRNSTMTVGIYGTPKSTSITDSVLGDLRIGSDGYGNSPGPFVCTRCKVTAWSNSGVFQDDNPSPYSMIGGVISFPNTAATGSGPAQRWASTIGKDIFFSTDGSSGQYTSLGVFRILGVTQDATNVYVQTNQAGGFPTLTNFGTRIQFRANGAQQFTNDNPDPSSDPVFLSMSVQNGATPLAPMMTYGKRAYTPTTAATLGQLFGKGKIVSLTVDVTVASTHTGAIALTPTSVFFYNTVKQSNWTVENFFPTINLKQIGTRVITPSGVTCNTGGGPVAGGCAGDSITAPTEAIWLSGALSPTTTGGFSGGVDPQFTITIQTDQTP